MIDVHVLYLAIKLVLYIYTCMKFIGTSLADPRDSHRNIHVFVTLLLRS